MVEMILTLRQQDGRAAFLEHANDVVDHQPITVLILREDAVDVLDAAAARLGRYTEPRLSYDEFVNEWAVRRLALGIYSIADRPKLHLGNGLAAIAPLRRGGESDE